MTVVEQCRAALVEALKAYGDEEAAAIALERVAALPYEGDLGAYVQAVASIVRGVWQRKLDMAVSRVEQLQREAVAMRAMGLMQPSDTIH